MTTMKRKLNDEGEPEALVPPPAEKPSKPSAKTFQDFNLDVRLLQAIAEEKFQTPTPVQQAAIPIIFEGKDILARARTGSGKTAAYILPVLESILQAKKADPEARSISSLILVPTKELAEQVTKVCKQFSSKCAGQIVAQNLTQKVSESVQRAKLAELPDVLVSTPARVTQCVSTHGLSLDNIRHVVLDEADLLQSYGYEDDLTQLAELLPPVRQTIMMSATLSTEVDTIKELFCRDPLLLELDSTDDDDKLVQYVVKCGEQEKFLLFYVIFKLKLIKGKCIVFVADVDRCYRLKLFLEQFGIKSCVLNSELPVNSRIHVVEEFNKNVYDIIIASDEHEVIGSELQKAKKAAEKAAAEREDEEETMPSKKKQKTSKKDREYGVARGIDFKNVSFVLNFDLPPTAQSYIHRTGRTARAGKSGMAMSFVIPHSEYRKHKPTTIPSTEKDEQVFKQILAGQAKKGQEVKDYHFDMAQVEPFRYRMTDALRAVTRASVREARTRELRAELINSEKLKKHFEENPDDLHHLRHDGELRAARTQAHLKHVPDYLLPNNGGKIGEDLGFVSLRKPADARSRKAKHFKRMKGKAGRAAGRANPLKTFSMSKRK